MNNFKKISVVMLSALMIQMYVGITFASDNNSISQTSGIKTVTYSHDDDSYNTDDNIQEDSITDNTDYEIKTITPDIDDYGNVIYYNEDNNSIDINSLNNLSSQSNNQENSELPAYYDLRDGSRITSVKNQDNEK